MKYVYIIDDDPLLRKSIHYWLSAKGYDPRSFSTPLDFIDDLKNLSPGCVLLDVRMPIIDGIHMLEQYGPSLEEMEVIMMTGYADVDMAVNAMKLGAFDFIQKPFKQEELIDAIERAHQRLFAQAADAEQLQKTKSLVNALTPREKAVLTGISKGYPNKLIAYELNLSVRTVEMHRANVMKKLRVRSQAQLVKIVLEAGGTI